MTQQAPAYIYNLSDIMTRAWDGVHRRQMSAIRGGKTPRPTRQLLAESLRSVWVAARREMIEACATASQQPATKPAPAAGQAKHRVLIALAQRQQIARYIPAGAVVDEFGKSFRISDDHPSLHGSHLLGHEGEMGCYCYYYAN